MAGGDEQAWYNLGVSSQDTDGINSRRQGSNYYEPDADGYRNLSGTLNAGVQLGGLAVDGTLMRAKAHNDYDDIDNGGYLHPLGGHGANADNRQEVIGGRARFSPRTSGTSPSGPAAARTSPSATPMACSTPASTPSATALPGSTT